MAKTSDTMSGPLAMVCSRITGVTDPNRNQDAATKNYTDGQSSLRVARTCDTMSGALDMGGSKITELADPTSSQDATTKNCVGSPGHP